MESTANMPQLCPKTRANEDTLRGREHRDTQDSVGSHIKLEIFTLSTSEPFPGNNPLRWMAFSFILFAWNSLTCCVWAFFCRMAKEKSSVHPTTLFVCAGKIRQTNKCLISTVHVSDDRPFYRLLNEKQDSTAKCLLSRGEQRRRSLKSRPIILISHLSWCNYSNCMGTENRDSHTVLAEKWETSIWVQPKSWMKRTITHFQIRLK